jgi:hypothetical protein
MKSTGIESFFQFPLSMIRKAKSTPDVMNEAVTYSLWNFGESMSDADVRVNYCDYHKRYPELLHDNKDRIHQMIMAAASKLGVKLGSVSHEAGLGDWYVRLKTQRGFQVRLRTDIAWDARDHKWHFLKFKTVCAVYAAIGNRGAAQLDHRLLRALVSGFNSPNECSEGDMVPESTLRYWLDHCHQRKLFKLCLHNGLRWYGISKGFATDMDLAKWVKKRHGKRARRPVISTDDIPD